MPASPKGYRTSKDEVLNTDEMAQRNRNVGQWQVANKEMWLKLSLRPTKIGRNERVVIRNVSSGETKTVKFKQAEPLINNRMGNQ